MSRLRRGSLVLLLGLATGCADVPLHLVEEPRPVDPPDVTPETYTPAEGSLWRGPASKRFLAFENRAKRVGDLITVVIDESADATTQASTELDRETEYDVNLGSGVALQTLVTRPILNLLGLLGFTRQKTDKNPTGNVEVVNAETTSAFVGEGKLEREANFTTTIACVVTGVSAAGLLKIEGQRHLSINRERQIIELSGWVRPEDIRIDNTVPSRLIASADIRYGGHGAMSNKQMDPWLTRVFDKLLPF